MVNASPDTGHEERSPIVASPGPFRGPCAAGVAPPPQPAANAIDVEESVQASNTENFFMGEG